MPSTRVLALALAGATGLALLSPSTALAAPPAAGSHPFQAHLHAPRAARLAGHSRGALRAVAAAAASVTRVGAQEQASGWLSAADKTAAAAFNAAALAALARDVTAVSATTDAPAVAGVVRSAKRTAEGVRTVRQVLTASGRLSARATVLTTASVAPVGVVTAAGAAAQQDLAAAVDVARTALAAADTAVLAIPAAPTVADLRSARSAAHTALRVAHTALASAAADLEVVRGSWQGATTSRTS